MENLEAIKIKAEQLTVELAANDAANAAEHAAACELLAKVIEIAKPAIRSVGNKLETHWHSRRESECKSLPGRYLNLRGYKFEPARDRTVNRGNYDGEDIGLDVAGMIFRVSWSGEFSDWQGESSSWQGEITEVNLAEEKAKEITRWIENICEAIASAGSRADATKATLARAEKLAALAKLL